MNTIDNLDIAGWQVKTIEEIIRQHRFDRRFESITGELTFREMLEELASAGDKESETNQQEEK